MEKEFNNISKLIKEIRSANKISQTDLSHKLGYKGGQFVSNVERGQCSIPAKAVPILCREFGVDKQKVVTAMVQDFEVHLKNTVGLEETILVN